MALPKERRNAREVETEIRLLVDRALANLREDATAFAPMPAQSKPVRQKKSP